MKTNDITIAGSYVIVVKHMDPTGNEFKRECIQHLPQVDVVDAPIGNDFATYNKARKSERKSPYGGMYERSTKFANSQGVPYVVMPQIYAVDAALNSAIAAAPTTVGTLLGEDTITAFIASGSSPAAAIANWGTTSDLSDSSISGGTYSFNVGENKGWLTCEHSNSLVFSEAWYPTVGSGDDGDISTAIRSWDRMRDFIIAKAVGSDRYEAKVIAHDIAKRNPSSITASKAAEWYKKSSEFRFKITNFPSFMPKRDSNDIQNVIDNNLVLGQEYFTILKDGDNSYAYTLNSEGTNFAFFSPQNNNSTSSFSAGLGMGLGASTDSPSGFKCYNIFHQGGVDSITQRVEDKCWRIRFKKCQVQTIPIPVAFANEQWEGNLEAFEDYLVEMYGKFEEDCPECGTGHPPPGGDRFDLLGGFVNDNRNGDGGKDLYDPSNPNSYWGGVSEDANGNGYPVTGSDGNVYQNWDTTDLADSNVDFCKEVNAGTLTAGTNCEEAVWSYIILLTREKVPCLDEKNDDSSNSSVLDDYNTYSAATGVDAGFDVSSQHSTSTPATGENNPSSDSPQAL